MSPDPNATGVPVQSSLAMLGKMPSGPPSGSFDHTAHYGDGWDIFTAYGANPIQMQDPTGLFFSLGGLGSAGAIRNTLTEAYGEAGVNSIVGLEQIAAGIAASQVIVGMLADGVMGGAAGRAFDYALNMAKGIGRAAKGLRARGSVWSQPPLERGRSIEQLRGMNLPSNFPTVDKWNSASGVATSIKSLDTSANTYQSLSKMRSRIKVYIHKVRDFKGTDWAGVRIRNSEIRQRELELVIPVGVSKSQLGELSSLQRYANSQGVVFKIVPMP